MVILLIDQSGWTTSQVATAAISAAALGLSLLNFALARRSANRNDLRSRRDDRREADRLLNAAWPNLWGRKGFAETKDQAVLDAIESAVDEAGRLDPHNPRVIEYRGHILEVQGNVKAARRLYEQSIQADPLRARAHICLGHVVEGDEKIAAFTKALTCDATDIKNISLAHYNLANEYFRQRSHEKANDHVEQALQHRPNYTDALVLLGRIRLEVGDRDGARSACEKAISASPNCIPAMVLLGLLLSATDFAAGVAWLEYAAKTDPTNDYPIIMLGAIHADNNAPEVALRYYEQAVAINPKCGTREDITHHLAEELRALLRNRKTEADGVPSPPTA